MLGLQHIEASATADASNAGSSKLECDFYMYLFKVQPCPKRGAHDWSSCPYAHPKEKARRRDPRVYNYASTPCPESLQGVNCGRGVDCPYAHSVYEYWLHPARFRTQMCKKGNQCNRTLCFFAHSASELRFPETSDEAEAAAVDAAAASATAGPLPPCTQSNTSALAMMPSTAGSSASSLPLMNLGSVCSDPGTGIIGLGPSGSGSYNMVAVQALAGSMRQNSTASQLAGLVDEMSGSFGFGGSDPGVLLPGLAMQQQQMQMQAQPASQSLSDMLPGINSDTVNNTNSSAAWLQLAAASQLPASQILSSIRPPGAATLAGQQPGQMLRTATATGYTTLPGSAVVAAAGPRAVQQAGAGARVCGMQQLTAQLMGGGSGAAAGPLVQPPTADSSANQLAAGLAGISLQGGLVDDSSSSSCVTTVSAAGVSDPHMYVALSAAAGPAGPMDMSLLQAPMGTSPPQAAASSRSEDFLLLQLLQQQQQEKQLQQQQQQQRLVRLGSSIDGAAAGGMFAAGALSSRGVPPQAGASWGLRLQ